MTYQLTGNKVNLPNNIIDREYYTLQKLQEHTREMDPGMADILLCGYKPDGDVVLNHQNYGSIVLNFGELYNYLYTNYPEELL